MIYSENRILKLFNALSHLRGKRICHCSSGGGCGSIILLETESNKNLWAWCYWEIQNGCNLISSSEDDATAIIGPIARTCNELEGRMIEDFRVFSDYTLVLLIEGNYRLVCFTDIFQKQHKADRMEFWSLDDWDTNTIYIISPTGELDVFEGISKDMEFYPYKS